MESSPLRCRAFLPVLLVAFAGAEAAAAAEPAVNISDAPYWDNLYSEPERQFPGVKNFSHNFHGVDLASIHAAIEESLGAAILSHPASASALVLGSGDSGLPEELSAVGWTVAAVDRSKVIVEDMGARNRDAELTVQWVVGDATSLSFPADSFSMAIEVGLLDALEASGEDAGMQQVISEAYRVLRPDGILLSVSTQPPFFRGRLLQHDLPGEWRVEPLRLPRARSLDPRVVALDPAIGVGNLTLYVVAKSLPPVVSFLPAGSHQESDLDSVTQDEVAEPAVASSPPLDESADALSNEVAEPAVASSPPLNESTDALSDPLGLLSSQTVKPSPPSEQLKDLTLHVEDAEPLPPVSESLPQDSIA